MELAEVVGHLAGLRRFAVRSLGGESPDEALVVGSGLVGADVKTLRSFLFLKKKWARWLAERAFLLKSEVQFFQ